MIRTHLMLPVAVLVTSLLVIGCAGKNADRGQYSGYLEDYSRMEKTKDVMGESVLRFVSPDLNRENYQKVLIEPVLYFPEPDPTDRVSAQTLDDIKNYIDQEFRKKVNEKVPVVDQPGAGVVRMRVGVTAVGAVHAEPEPVLVVEQDVLDPGAVAFRGPTGQQRPGEALGEVPGAHRGSADPTARG